MDRSCRQTIRNLIIEDKQKKTSDLFRKSNECNQFPNAVELERKKNTQSKENMLRCPKTRGFDLVDRPFRPNKLYY